MKPSVCPLSGLEGPLESRALSEPIKKHIMEEIDIEMNVRRGEGEEKG